MIQQRGRLPLPKPEPIRFWCMREATDHLYGVLQHIAATGVRAGVVVNPGTPLSSLEEVLPLVDQVLVMTVNPGFGGQKFLTAMVDKLARLHQLRQDRGLHFDIEVDGGINAKTVKAAADAGTDIFVAGSYVFSASDVGAAISSYVRRFNDNYQYHGWRPA